LSSRIHLFKSAKIAQDCFRNMGKRLERFRKKAPKVWLK
jgi:hypothetical protein